MKLALLGGVLAWLAVVMGLTLAVCYARGRRAPKVALWAHPVLAVLAVACLWAGAILWPGAKHYLFNSGTFVVTLAFLAGGLLFALRRAGNRAPMIVIGMHAAVALIGCAVLTAGLPR